MVLLSRQSSDEIAAAPHLADRSVTFIPDAGQVFQKYNIRALPRTLLLTQERGELANFEGYSDDHMAALRTKVREVLAETP